MTITIYNSNTPLPAELFDATVDFLFEHLGRFGDPHDDIRKAMEHALKEMTPVGGFICLATQGHTIVGAAVINRTGMERYIPENILVYIAVHSLSRGQGLGRRIMEQVIGLAQGGIALHVEPDNPARCLYENLGFKSKYLEMRLDRKEVL